MTAVEIPATGSAEVHVLHDGYVGLDVDPGVVADHGASFRPGTPGTPGTPA